MPCYALVGIPVGPGRDDRRILWIDAASRVRWVDGDKKNIPSDLPGRCPAEWRELEP